MKILLSCLLLAFWGLPSHAQNQEIGYEGKRMFLEVGVTLGPNFFTPTAYNRGPNPYPEGRRNTGHFTLADRYSIAFNYILSPKHTLHAGYDFCFFGAAIGAITRSKLPQTFYSWDTHNIFYQLAAHDINVNIAISPPNPRNIAPKGFYWSFGLRFLFVKGYQALHRVEYYQRPFLTDEPIEDLLNPLNINTFTFMVGLTAQWGYRVVIAKKILLNFGLQLNFFPQVFFSGPYPNAEDPEHNQKIYQQNVISNLFSRNLGMLHIGVGMFLK